jgi:hypothetical protein
MENTLKQNEKKPAGQGNQRRAFFGQVLAAVGGGLVGGSLLKKIFSSRPEDHQDDATIKLTAHPLAVPRTKEGSKSHV